MNVALILTFQITYFIVSLHYFQWKGYYPKRYLKYLFKNKLIIVLNILIFIQIIINLIKIGLNIDIFIINLIFFIFNIFILILFLSKKKKIKFVFTARVLRLIFINIILLLPLCFANHYIMYTISVLTPFWLLTINLLDVKKYILDNKALELAISKLESNKNLITIGVTGSNGKTSVKEILNKLLSTKYNVITTQKNQNTPKGAILAINKYLSSTTEIFICEMGARKVGDIKEICNLTNPTLGIITSVSPQHLETFKNELNIYSTKKELPDYLGEKYCVYNYDNPLTNQMFGEKIGKKSAVSTKSKTKIYASNIQVINFQTYFDIHYNNNVYPCHTNLLGEHNVTNILLAMDMALHLGIDINEAIQTIISLNPTPHRLEYIKSHIDIIDDSYNCSINSATQAVKVLSKINKNKVICTPGIIEGGKQQFNLNQQLSSLLSQTADILIIVGKTNRKALISQLDDFEILYIPASNIFNNIFNKKSIININNITIDKASISNLTPSNKKRAYIVDTLEVAKQLFTRLLNGSHVLLLLNDLPDEYN